MKGIRLLTKLTVTLIFAVILVNVSYTVFTSIILNQWLMKVIITFLEATVLTGFISIVIAFCAIIIGGLVKLKIKA